MSGEAPLPGELVELAIGGTVQQFMVAMVNHDGTLELSYEGDLGVTFGLDYVPADWVTVVPPSKPALKSGDFVHFTSLYSDTNPSGYPVVTPDELPGGILLRGTVSRFLHFKGSDGEWACAGNYGGVSTSLSADYEVLYVPDAE